MEETETEEMNETETEQMEETRTKKMRGKTMENDNVVFIGKKGVMSYVLAVITQFNNGAPEVIVKARGRAISRAVDVAEIVRQRFVQDLKTKDIKIATEEIQGDEGPIKVSAIELTLAK